MRKNNKKSPKKTKTYDATANLVPENYDNTATRNTLKPKTKNQSEYIRNIAENTITFCQGLAGSGKALTLDSRLFTRNGPITMGDINVGDEIANPDGGFSKVLAVYPQGKKQICRVHFSNNTSVDCCEEHLWSVYQDGKKDRLIVNTKYLEDNARRPDGKRILSIPCTKPVNFDRKNYKIDPYLLGIIISEGNCTNGNVVFTTCEPQILQKINSLLHNDYVVKTKNNIDHRIVKKNRSSYANFYKEELKNLGIWEKYSYEKYIPHEYKYGSIDQRISLLQGLMDGDGTVSKTGSCSYSTTSLKLAHDLCELVYSLGGTTKIKEKKGSKKIDGSRHRMSFRLHISLPNDICIFFLDRKKKKIIARTKYFPKLYINKVERLCAKEMQCIRVDHKDSLYLTDHYIPTHNTHIAIGMALEYLLEEKVKKIIITRPVLEAGEKIGYLPGTAEEKLHPYLLPIIDEINHFISTALYASLKLNNKIEVVPLGLMRGRNFHNSFIVADECQNATYEQLKMLLTRIGINSKMVLTGDVAQSDLRYDYQGGFISMIKNLEDVDGIGLCSLESSDIIRNPIISRILSRLDSYERKNT